VNFTGILLSYTVSGYVKDEAGNGIAGVTISFSGGYEAVTTDSEGHWSKEGRQCDHNTIEGRIHLHAFEHYCNWAKG